MTETQACKAIEVKIGDEEARQVADEWLTSAQVLELPMGPTINVQETGEFYTSTPSPTINNPPSTSFFKLATSFLL